MELFNLQAEQSILGTIILNNEYLRRVEDILEAKHFYFAENLAIYERIMGVKKDDVVANKITLQTFFNSNESIKAVGGQKYLLALLSEASAIIDIRDYAITIAELWRKRELLAALESIKENLESEKVENLLTKFEDTVKTIDDTSTTIQVFDGEEAIADWAFEAEKKEQLKPISSGLKTLDDMLNGGFHKEGLYVFAAASGCGKTFFSQNVILNALKLRIGVFFASMEMSKRKIMARFISILAKINFFRVLIANIFDWEKERFDLALREWQGYQKNFFIVEKMAMSPKEIEFAFKRSLKKSAIGLVVVDYAQILKLREGRNFNEASLIKENVNALAKLAQKYKVAVILLSQLTKDKISGKVGLGSLKGSGGLYEDADCVIAMWADEDSKDKIKKLQIEVLKNREGLAGGFSITFNGDIGEFKETNF
jgi:replicative DNA helicase